MICSNYPTARAFFRNCYKPLKLRGASPDASRLHECTLNNFAKFLGREATFDDYTDDTIAGFLSWLSDRGRSAATVNDNRNRVMSLARFAVKKRVLDEEPEVEALNEPERVVRAWLSSDLDRLFAELHKQTGTIAGAPAKVWWLALHLVFLFTGERCRAVMSLRWDQIDLQSGWMVLTAEQRKGGKRDKEWPLPARAIEVLTALKRHAKTELVFEREFCLETVYNRYKRILKAAGLPSGRNAMFHCMRRTTASQFAAAGGNATELLDHSSARVTKKYLDLRIVKRQSASDLLEVPKSAQ